MIQKGRAQLRATYDFPSHGDNYIYLLDLMKIITSTQGSSTNEEWRANRVGIWIQIVRESTLLVIWRVAAHCKGDGTCLDPPEGITY